MKHFAEYFNLFTTKGSFCTEHLNSIPPRKKYANSSVIFVKSTLLATAILACSDGTVDSRVSDDEKLSSSSAFVSSSSGQIQSSSSEEFSSSSENPVSSSSQAEVSSSSNNGPVKEITDETPVLTGIKVECYVYDSNDVEIYTEYETNINAYKGQRGGVDVTLFPTASKDTLWSKEDYSQACGPFTRASLRGTPSDAKSCDAAVFSAPVQERCE
ncbi:hypothetical protein AGMMS49938_15590 [Fibrobacterales bacterium]|nr:hypothetical protein AGMMS49938_15590 [Fibrobacterales bacterium]